MPEGPEVETEKLHEAIHEELERQGGTFLRSVALTTALLAALAAIASLQAGATVNEAHRHHAYADAVALIQVAIALGAVAALTRMRLVWLGSVVLGAAGLVVFLLPLMR